MSRTDKDAPWWVQTDWYVPMHEMCQAGPYPRYRWQTSQRGARECDLPETPVRKAKSYRRRSIWRLTEEQMHCYWEPEWPWEQRRYSFIRGPRREDRRLAWWGPNRCRPRDECRAARKEYRGFGDVETDVSKLHHNHAPRKGYWD